MQAEHNGAPGQQGSVNIQSQQSSRFGSTGYVQNGPQSTAVQSTSNIGGSSGINYNRFGAVQGGNGVSAHQQISQQNRGQTGAGPGAAPGRPANTRQNPQVQPAASDKRLSTAPRNQQPAAPNRFQTNPAARQVPVSGIRLTPNFRTPPVPDAPAQGLQDRTAEPQADTTGEQPERKEQEHE